MTAGMVPMALGWSEGSEQTAPLARAVIGGLVAATFATLTVLPTVFALVQGWASRESASLDPDDPASTHYHDEEAEANAMRPAVGQWRFAGSQAPGYRPASRWLAATIQEFDPHVRNIMPCERIATFNRRGDRNRPGGACFGMRATPRRQGRSDRPAARDRSRSCIPSGRPSAAASGEPGELQAFETTAIHAKIAGYVKNWTVNIGAAVKKGQILAELSVPELDAELRQKQAAIEQAVAKHKQAEAAVEVAEANVEGRRGEARRGPGRQAAGRGRPRPLASRVPPHRGIACGAGVRPAACSTRPGASSAPPRPPARRSRPRSRRRMWP